MHATAANGNASTVAGNDGGFERRNRSSGDQGWARPRLAALLLVADGRFPAGGYAHSGGLEEAVKAGRVHDEATLLAFLAGRLQTAGVVEAHLAVAAWSACAPAAALGAAFDSAAVRRVDAEAAARCPSAALRGASRSQGRALVRAASAIMPFEPGAQSNNDRGRASVLGGIGGTKHFPQGPMMPVAIGTVGYCFELSATELGLWAAYASVSGPGWAATRLLGLDPFAVGRCLAQLSGEVEAVASGALESPTSLADLPAGSAPLIEMGAEAHQKWEVRLFAS